MSYFGLHDVVRIRRGTFRVASRPRHPNSNVSSVIFLTAHLASHGLSLHLGSMAVPAPNGAPRETLLILSDVHLGSDINDKAPPGAAPRRSQRVDDDLTALFRHY